MDDRMNAERRRLGSLQSASNAIHPAPTQFSADQLAADPILHFFHYAHLPAALQGASQPFCELAEFIVALLPRNAERSVALRKLLEAKDCALRANKGPDTVASSKPETFFDRLVKERDELKGRLDKLGEFLDGDQQGASPIQAGMLYDQREAMQVYLDTLEARISNLRSETELGEIRETGGHDIGRDGPLKFDG